jgi:hypothetical protein
MAESLRGFPDLLWAISPERMQARRREEENRHSSSIHSNSDDVFSMQHVEAVLRREALPACRAACAFFATCRTTAERWPGMADKWIEPGRNRSLSNFRATR